MKDEDLKKLILESNRLDEIVASIDKLQVGVAVENVDVSEHVPVQVDLLKRVPLVLSNEVDVLQVESIQMEVLRATNHGLFHPLDSTIMQPGLV